MAHIFVQAVAIGAFHDHQIGIANRLDPISTVSRARLEGAMDRIAGAPDKGEFAALVDQRDALLAMA